VFTLRVLQIVVTWVCMPCSESLEDRPSNNINTLWYTVFCQNPAWLVIKPTTTCTRFQHTSAFFWLLTFSSMVGKWRLSKSNRLSHIIQQTFWFMNTLFLL